MNSQHWSRRALAASVVVTVSALAAGQARAANTDPNASKVTPPFLNPPPTKPTRPLNPPPPARQLSSRALTGAAQHFANQKLGGAWEAHHSTSLNESAYGDKSAYVTVKTPTAIRVIGVEKTSGKVTSVSKDLSGQVLGNVRRDEQALKGAGSAQVKLGGKVPLLKHPEYSRTLPTVTRGGNVRTTESSGRGTQGRISIVRDKNSANGNQVTADPSDGKATNRVPNFKWVD